MEKYVGKKSNQNLIYIAICALLLILGGCGQSSESSGGGPTAPTTAQSRPAAARPDWQGRDLESNRSLIARARQILASLTLDQKLGQLIIVEYLGHDYQSSGLQEMIRDQYVGGFMYQESNHNFDAPYNSISAIAEFSQQAMQDAKVPLLIATDQEGGLVNRLYRFHGPLPSAAEMAASGKPSYAYQQGSQAAEWMRQLGINSDLAPVVDVHSVDPPVLETRMFGRDPQTVATYAGAYLQGLQEHQVAGCLKHFPGLGAITSDPHSGLPVVNRDLTTLNRIDLAPYRIMIPKYQPAMIMATDVLMPAIDPQLPAELSPKAIDGVLRQQLGYDGVVITDGLYMRGISEHWSLSEAAVMAIEAGNDLIEGPYTPQQVADVVSALKAAIQQGQLTEARIDQSVERILTLKLRYGIIR
ncbi:glycoside hydrolase family 3 protein [Thermogemmatispora sp.]|uniref:glycoside hydrolase family 3 protein n=1 Tax=Thermogemmatispora sp. TaxID=1968838 RepID=UPI0035E44BF0